VAGLATAPGLDVRDVSAPRKVRLNAGGPWHELTVPPADVVIQHQRALRTAKRDMSGVLAGYEALKIFFPVAAHAEIEDLPLERALALFDEIGAAMGGSPPAATPES
jgi:hypothetical protein